MKTSGKVVASGVALAVVGGGIWAVTAFGFNNVDLAEAAPQGSASYMEINLDPSVSQKVSAMSIGKKITSITGDESTENGNLMKGFAEDDFPGLNYEEDIDPWLGDKAATVGFNDKFDNVSVYSIDNKSEADEKVKKISEADEKKKLSDKDLTYEVKDKWIIVAPNKSIMESYNKSLEGKSNLSEDEVFKSDRKAAGDNIAFGWADLSKMNNKAEELSGSNTPEISGRIAAALSLSSNSVDINAKTYAMKVDGETSWNTEQKGIELLQDFSESAVGGFELVDLSNNLKNNFNQLTEDPDLKVQIQEGLDPVEETLGVKIPEELEKIFGTNLAFAYNETNTMEVAVKGADKEVWQDLYDLASTFAGDEDFGTFTTVDDVQKFMYDYTSNGEKESENKLGDTERFKQVLPNLEEAQFAAYLDIDKMIKLDQVEEKRNEEVDEGVIGVSVSYDKDKDESQISAKWLLSTDAKETKRIYTGKLQ